MFFFCLYLLVCACGMYVKETVCYINKVPPSVAGFPINGFYVLALQDQYSSIYDNSVLKIWSVVKYGIYPTYPLQHLELTIPSQRHIDIYTERFFDNNVLNLLLWIRLRLRHPRSRHRPLRKLRQTRQSLFRGESAIPTARRIQLSQSWTPERLRRSKCKNENRKILVSGAANPLTSHNLVVFVNRCSSQTRN